MRFMKRGGKLGEMLSQNSLVAELGEFFEI